MPTAHAADASSVETAQLVGSTEPAAAAEPLDAAGPTAATSQLGEDADPKWLARLNDQQRLAATHSGGDVMIVAGAGTGKTGTLAARVAWLLESGARPDRILLLTFTRRASQEMLGRAEHMTRAGGASRVWGGTFHAVANRLLRHWGPAIGLDSSFTVMDQSDTRELFGVVRAEMVDHTMRRFPKKETLASIYDRMVSAQQRLDTVLKADFPWCLEHADAIAQLCTSYTQRKRRRNVLDYDDLLLFWRALVAAPSVGEEVRSRFEHVLVDEFQDTNPIQADIVHAYGDGGAQVTVVGDDAQAIYGFRNATVENMWSFPDRRPSTTRITLEENYRSTTPVLDLANDVLDASEIGFEKHLWSKRVGTRRPRLVTCFDEAAQSVAVADRVLELREEGMALMDQAVLFRASHHSDMLELELAGRDIPFVKFGGLKFLETAHIKDLMATLRVLENPRDELAWHRVLRLLPGVGSATVTKIMAQIGVSDSPSGEADVDPDGAMRMFLEAQIVVPGAARPHLAALREAFLQCVGEGEAEPPPAVQVDALRAVLGPLFEEHYERSESRIADLDVLGRMAGQYQQRSRLLTELVLDPPASTGDLADEPHLDDDYLILSTIHSAKGGEWSAVHLIHAADGNLPSDMALSDKNGLEEERRLAYVAVTRAKDVLDIYVPQRYHHRRYGTDDSHNFAPVSRFFSPLVDRFDQVAVGGNGAVIDGTAESTARFGVADEVDSMLFGLWE